MYLGYEAQELSFKHLVDQHDITSLKRTSMVYMTKSEMERKHIDIEQQERNELVDTADIEHIIHDHKYQDFTGMLPDFECTRRHGIDNLDSQLQRFTFEPQAELQVHHDNLQHLKV
jgi:hypothetical protein